MDAQLALFALQDVPRYTSYPTAVQFASGFPPERADKWIAELAPDAALSVYLHIPFCRQLCWYCGCHTSVPNAYQRAMDYTQLLLKDIGRTAGLVAKPQGRVKHVHFGGGTPTYLKDHDLAAIVAAIGAQLGLANDAEIAIEIDPRTIDRARENTQRDGLQPGESWCSGF